MCNAGRAYPGKQRFSKKEYAGLRPFQRAELADGPLALMDAAGIALQPGFRPVADVARKEVAALEPVLRIGVGDRRDRSARAGEGILPRKALTRVAARSGIIFKSSHSS